MNLVAEIARKRVALSKAKPRSERNIKVQRELVHLMLKQLRKENRQDKRA